MGMSNADRIRSMTDEELAEVIAKERSKRIVVNEVCNACDFHEEYGCNAPFTYHCVGERYKEVVLRWLRSDAKNMA